MKNTFLVVLVIVCSIGTTTLKAQSDDYKSNASFSTGFSAVGILFDVFGALSDSTGIDTKSIPALQLNYDYSLANFFSLGGSISHQAYDLGFTDYPVQIDSITTTISDFNVNISRTNFALRALFHYGNKGKLDMYSGVRLGITRWGAKSGTIDTQLLEDIGQITGIDVSNVSGELNESVLGFSPQLILFGLRGYITDNIGLGFESALGAPHFLSLSVNYRF